jgi:glucokinase
MSTISIGADIGGSHITTMAVDLASRTMLRETYSRYDVSSNGNAEDILNAWKAALADTITKLSPQDLSGIGFAMPGPFDYPNGIALFNGVKKFDSLHGINIRLKINSLPGLPRDVPIRFLNDATCFAIGEAWLGKASKFERIIGITLGTGFGSAFLEQGIPISTGQEVPANGWVYHLPFGNSIADDQFSTRWFIKRYYEISGKMVEGVKEIASSYTTDRGAQGLFNEFGLNLGQFLAPLVKKFNAKCLVIGGSIAQSYELFQHPFISGLEKNKVTGLHVYASAAGEEAAIAGSARLGDDRFYNNLVP